MGAACWGAFSGTKKKGSQGVRGTSSLPQALDFLPVSSDFHLQSGARGVARLLCAIDFRTKVVH